MLNGIIDMLYYVPNGTYTCVHMHNSTEHTERIESKSIINSNNYMNNYNSIFEPTVNYLIADIGESPHTALWKYKKMRYQ